MWFIICRRSSKPIIVAPMSFSIVMNRRHMPMVTIAWSGASCDDSAKVADRTIMEITMNWATAPLTMLPRASHQKARLELRPLVSKAFLRPGGLGALQERSAPWQRENSTMRAASSTSEGSAMALPWFRSRLPAVRPRASTGAAQVSSRPSRQSQNQEPSQMTTQAATLLRSLYMKCATDCVRENISWVAIRDMEPADDGVNQDRGSLATLSPML